jgi:hypothetical protein
MIYMINIIYESKYQIVRISITNLGVCVKIRFKNSNAFKLKLKVEIR